MTQGLDILLISYVLPWSTTGTLHLRDPPRRISHLTPSWPARSASGSSCSSGRQGQCQCSVKEGATGGDLIGADWCPPRDPPSPPQPDQCPSSPPPPPASASVVAAWVPVHPTVLPCPLPPPQHLHYLVGPPPSWADLGTSVAACGRHGHDDAFHNAAPMSSSTLAHAGARP